ncbi:hypothetical protein Fmac_001093 [Flemingia macrophylla]|uniref:Uncharacterized protein n=1 Tax=Flemingia macrophylla TaxID=520843 RepID=A0ABD1NGT6_9FABA
MRTFSWSEIVDRCFPVCHVHMDGTIVEVSSFDTTKCKAGWNSPIILKYLMTVTRRIIFVG